GDCEGHADTEAAECTRVHVRARGQTCTGEAKEISSIRDRNVIRRCGSSDRVENRARVDLAVAPGCRLVFCRFAGGDACTVTFAQAVGPGLVEAAFAIAG